MRHIQKTQVPQFFIDDTSGMTKWDEYKNGKETLREYILTNEQSYLCIYCEKIITADQSSSHLEHVEPKCNDDKLIFDYNNISVSCNGVCQPANNQTIHKETCGHKKDNNFDSSLFVNPITTPDVSDYYAYNTQYEIIPSNKNPQKANYTINLLGLNSPNMGLPQDRKLALKNFKDKVTQIANTNQLDKKEIIKKLLKTDNKAFISFLRYYFKDLIS